jgi:hypothetical protein
MGNKKRQGLLCPASISPIDSFSKTTQETTKHLVLLASLNTVTIPGAHLMFSFAYYAGDRNIKSTGIREAI